MQFPGIYYESDSAPFSNRRITHFFEVLKVKPYLPLNKRREERYIRYSSKGLYYKGFRQLNYKITS